MPTALPASSPRASWGRRLLKLLGYLVLAVLALILAIVAMQVYYRLTPATLSADAQRLAQETQVLPEQHDNALRLAGILAPETLDPVAYGRCVVEANKVYEENLKRPRPARLDPNSPAAHAEFQATQAEYKARLERCMPGVVELRLPQPKPGSFRIEPGFDWDRLVREGELALPPVLQARAEYILAQGPARLQPPGLMPPLSASQALLQLDQNRLARFAAAWDRATGEERVALLQAMAEPHTRWVNWMRGSLVDMSIAHTALLRSSLVVESALRRPGVVLDEALLTALDVALKPIDRTGESLAEAIAYVRREQAALFASLGPDKPRPVSLEPKSSLAAGLEALLWQTWDSQDSLNRLAAAVRVLQTAARDPLPSEQLGRELVKASGHLPCKEPLSLLCQCFQRNPAGRVAVGFSMSMYSEYSDRIHDLRNLARGVRATARARTGKTDGADTFDVYTRQAFAVSSESRSLRVPLRARHPGSLKDLKHVDLSL